jgi:hypothetical protein
MEKNPVAVPHASFRQRSRGRLDAGVKVSPGPGGVAPDDGGTVGEAACGLDQQRREIGGGDQRNGSRIDT